MFDSLKKMFSRSSKEEDSSKTTLLDEEIDQFERELQEKIHYMEERNSPPSSPALHQPEELSMGGARASQSLITPEEQKKIQKD